MDTPSDISPASGRQPGTVDIVRLGLPERIRKLRLDKRLSQVELAAKAGLTGRTIHDIESGRRRRVQEQTLLLIARGLDIAYEDLLAEVRPDDGGPAVARPRPWWRRRRWSALALAACGVLGVLGVLGWLRDTAGLRAEVVIEGNSVTVRDGLLRTELWRSTAQAGLSICVRAPWSQRVLLLGRYGDAIDSRGLEVRDLATGDLLWSFSPDVAPAVAAFGPDAFAAGRMGCAWVGPVDLDGDRKPELLAKFSHSLFYPTCIVRLDPQGGVMNAYWCKGAVRIIFPLDADADGKQEIYLGGTNNSPRYQGATIIVLDEDHFRGIAEDPPLDGALVPADGSLLRVIYPQFPEPIMAALGVTRIEIYGLDTHLAGSQGLRLLARAGEDSKVCLLTLDPQLRVHDFQVSDALAVLCSRLTASAGDDQQNLSAWVLPWLQSRVRIAAGVVDGSADPVMADARALP